MALIYYCSGPQWHRNAAIKILVKIRLAPRALSPWVDFEARAVREETLLWQQYYRAARAFLPFIRVPNPLIFYREQRKKKSLEEDEEIPRAHLPICAGPDELLKSQRRELASYPHGVSLRALCTYERK